MADKKLLEESTIRRFMKLANINEKESTLLSEGNVTTPYKGSQKILNLKGKHQVSKKRHSVKEGYAEEAMGHNRYEETMQEEDEMGMGMDSAPPMDGVGDEPGMEGGDTKTKVESAIEVLKDALNDILDAVDSDQRVESETGSEEASEEEPSEEPGDDMADEEPDFVAEADDLEEDVQEEGKGKPDFLKNKQNREEMEENLEEELDESIELVDEDLIETLLKRVTDRLVREAKSKSGGGSTSHKAKGTTYKPHGAGKGTGYSGSGKTLGHKGSHQAKVKKH